MLAFAAAGWLLAGPVPGRALRGAAPGHPHRRTHLVLTGAGVVTGTLLVLALAGPRAAGFVTMAEFVLGTGSYLVWCRAGDRRRSRAVAEVTRAGAVVAGLLRIGLVPEQAVPVAAQECAVLVEAAAALAVGADAGAALRTTGRRAGHEGLVSLARAWDLCRLSGAPVAPVIDRVAESLREDRATAAVVAAELAGPRATGQLLAFLPVIGLGLGYLVGGDPLGFLTGTPAGELCLIAGVGLACAGIVWTERLAGVARR